MAEGKLAPPAHAGRNAEASTNAGAGTSASAGATEPRAVASARPTLLGHLRIMRVDHWFKNVFVIPGIVAAVAIDPEHVAPDLVFRIVVGLISVCIVASSNYVINEIMDAPFDRHHPIKAARPVPSGQVHVPLAYLQWIALGALGLGLAAQVSTAYTITMVSLLLMGCLYNIPPIRIKDQPYLDVSSEAVNNPIRLVAGWCIATTAGFAPASLILSYWMIGSYFMALKRFAEIRTFADQERLARYRRSLAHLDDHQLLVSIVFYGSAAMLFFGAFIMRYRLELMLSFPLVALVMSSYLSVAFKENSAAQHPEKLYREPALMAVVIACTLLMLALLFWDIPQLHEHTRPTAPPIGSAR